MFCEKGEFNDSIEDIKKYIVDNGGICFLVVRFSKLNKDYILMGKDYLDFIKNNDRKSIPIEYFEDKGYEIEISYSPRLDYLKIIDYIIGGMNGK